MYRLAFSVLVPLLMSACAGGLHGGGHNMGYDNHARPPVSVGATPEPADPLARSISYTCEDLTTVVLTEGRPTAQVTLNSGLVLALARQPGAMGLRYGAPPHEFLLRGSEGTLFIDRKAWRCRAR